MKLLKKTVLVIVLMVALTVSAFSQVYVSAGGSALLPVEIGDGSTAAGSIEYGLGIRGGGAVGYDLNNGVLAEVEVSYSRANASQLCQNDRCVAISQEQYDEAPYIGSTSIMVNAQYELETGFSVRPYLGIGTGFQSFFLSFGKPKTGTTLQKSRRCLVFDQPGACGNRN